MISNRTAIVAQILSRNAIKTCLSMIFDRLSRNILNRVNNVSRGWNKRATPGFLLELE